MGLRGPQPVDRNVLWTTAGRWASFLFRLRDGEDGGLFHVEWEPSRLVTLGGRRAKVRGPRSIVKASVLRAGDAWKKLVEQLSPDETAVIEPVMPKPELWESLKRARSEREIRDAANVMRRWVADQQPRMTGASTFPDVIGAHAKELIEARELPSYPRSDRPRSDDKRIEFFAKVLAGLEIGIASATAI